MQAQMRVVSALGLGIAAALCGCQRLLSIEDPVAGETPVRDAAIDAASDAPPDAEEPCPAMRPPGSPLLLSEIVLTPTAGEMIEIVNTAADDVDLTTYYLSDSGKYYLLPAQLPAVESNDFIVKFPNGAHIPGHTALAVAIAAAADFNASYGAMPAFSVTDATMTVIAMNSTPQLTNTGEPVILFQWDGLSDLVRDVDIMIAGPSTGATNALPSKSNVPQDGPDTDTQTSQYAVDVGSIRAQTNTPGAGVSTKRLVLEGSHEHHDGNGNGTAGDDETSEDTAATWDGASKAFGAPTPGQVPPQLVRCP
jgi:hypothetical protein